MKTRLLNRLFTMQGFAISMIVSMLMMATLSSPALAQTAVTATPALTAASGVPASTPKPLLRNTFNHLKTGFPLRGAHLSVTCETCHLGGTFKGTPKNCAGCHTTGSLVAATPKSQNHIPTTKACDACHANGASFLTAVMDHTGLTEPCAVCHGGSYSPMVKSVPADAMHQQNSNLTCDSCHKNTFTFTGSGFDHTNTVGDCETCHNPVNGTPGAQSKPANHIPYIPLTQPCAVCHTPAVTPGWPHPTTFLGAVFDHSTLVPGTACITCHNGQYVGVLSKPATHIQTSQTCELCHTPSNTNVGGFKAPNWTMNHTGITTNCASCHAGESFQGATVVNKPAAHVTTSLACETCHSPTSTGIGGFAAPNWTMIHSGITTNCVSCHTGQTFPTAVTPKTKSFIPNHVTTTLDCSTCHSNTVTPDGFKDWAMNHTGITTSCSTCHLTSGDSLVGTTTVKGVPAGHVTIKTGVGCESCHTSTVVPGGFATWTMNHAANGNTTACATCHANGVSFYNALSLVTLNTTAHIPVAAIPCESCHAPASTSTGAFATSALPMGIPGHTLVNATLCSTCHDLGTSFTGVRTKSASHITTAAPCIDCHTQTNTSGFTTFLNAQFDHSTTSAVCSTCHGGTVAGIKAKTANHILTTQECNVCHTAPTGANAVAPAGYFAVPNPAMSHTGITTNCASCHNGSNVGTTVTTIVLGKPATHILTTASCETCHPSTSTNLNGFKSPNWVMSHAGITTGCASCHGGQSFQGSVPNPPVNKLSISNHIATTAPCENCHTDTTVPNGFKTATMNHSGITSGCISCHLATGNSTVGNTTVKGKPVATHVTTSLSCEYCHTDTTIGGFINWTMNHSANGNNSSCASCHLPGGDNTVTNTVSTVIKGKPGTHIVTLATCESCHSTTSTSTGGFAAPGWTMGTAGHTAIPSMPPAPTSRCDSCHNGQTFQGVTMVTSTSLSSPHPGTIPIGGADCGTCHGDVTSFRASTTYSHTSVATGSCSSCHGTPPTLTPVGLAKPAGHIVTTPANETCDDCHNNHVYTSGGFKMTGSYAHPGLTITSNCTTGGCHSTPGNQILQGAILPLATHIPYTGSACGSCHTNFATNLSFLGAVMNHTGITTGCATCHAASYPGVVIKPGTHITTTPPTAACENCHSPTSTSTGGFAAPNWTMSHTGITTGCSSCHNAQTFATGVKPVSKPSYHISTTASPACETCHSNTTTPGGFSTWTMNHTGITSLCASCHTGSTYGTTVVKGKPSNHITTAAACETCHSTTNTSTGGFAIPNPAMNHTLSGSTTACETCHNGANVGTAVTTIVLGKPATTHIPTSAPCVNCHTNTTTPGGFATWTMNHTGISSGCATCHASGMSFQNTSGTPLVTLNTTTHVPVGTLACELCHSTSNFATGGFSVKTTGWNMGATGHALVNATSCATCHNDGVTYTGVVLKDSIITHMATTASCDTCHTATNTSGYTTFLGATGAHTSNPKPSLGATCNGSSCHGTGGAGKNLIANHIPPGALDCDACHTYTTFVSPPVTTTHTAVAAVACSTCHNTGLTYVGITGGGLVVTMPTAGTAHITTAQTCNTCHTGTTYAPGSFNVWTMNHATNGNTASCIACHAATAPSFTNNGGTPLVKLSTTNHVPVGATDCATSGCHSATFTTGAFATSALTGGTMSAAGHAAVTSVCGTCHGTAGAAFSGVKIIDAAHISSSYYPAQDCGTNCHSVASTSNYSSGGFLLLNMAANVPSHTGTGVSPYFCSNCHNNTIAKGTASFVGHVAIGSSDCVGCHTQTNTAGYTNFLGATAGHDVSAGGIAAAAGNCATTCHKSGGSGKVFATQHIPSSTPGAALTALGAGQCDGCHDSSYSSMVFTQYNSAKIHTASNWSTALKCSQCHNGSYTAEGTVGAQAKTLVNHIPTAIADGLGLDCAACHYWNGTAAGATTSIVISPTGFAGKKTINQTMNHGGALGGAPYYCVTCHLKGVTYLSGAQLISHNGASTSKDCSNTSCHKPLGKTGSFGPYSPR